MYYIKGFWKALMKEGVFLDNSPTSDELDHFYLQMIKNKKHFFLLSFLGELREDLLALPLHKNFLRAHVVEARTRNHLLKTKPGGSFVITLFRNDDEHGINGLGPSTTPIHTLISYQFTLLFRC